jgi:acetyl-CoA acyltransferase
VHDAVIGGGVEHMGHVPMGVGFNWVDQVGSPWPPALMERYNLVPQGLSAEMIADQWEIPRSELDELAVRSHRLAHQATEEGRFERETIPFQVNGDTYVADQGIRPDTNLESLSQLKPAFKPDGKVTAGNASQISDGAAAVLLMSADKAAELGLTPRAKVVDQTTVGVDPVMMLTGPIPATRKLLERNGMTMDDIDLVEINEAFAPVVAAWQRELDPDMDRVNVNGGAMALGHPLGSTGARLLTTLLHELERSDKETGLVTMCCGGGLGTGTLIQRVERIWRGLPRMSSATPANARSHGLRSPRRQTSALGHAGMSAIGTQRMPGCGNCSPIEAVVGCTSLPRAIIVVSSLQSWCLSRRRFIGRPEAARSGTSTPRSSAGTRPRTSETS